MVSKPICGLTACTNQLYRLMNSNQKKYSNILIKYLIDEDGYGSFTSMKSKFNWIESDPKSKEVIWNYLIDLDYIKRAHTGDNLILRPKGWTFESWEKENEKNAKEIELITSTIRLNRSTLDPYSLQKIATYIAVLISLGSIGLSFWNTNKDTYLKLDQELQDKLLRSQKQVEIKIHSQDSSLLFHNQKMDSLITKVERLSIKLDSINNKNSTKTN